MFSSYTLERAPWLLSTVLNALAGVLNVLPKTVSGAAADPDDRQEGGDEYQNNDAFNGLIHNFILLLPRELAGIEPLFLTRPQAIGGWRLACFRPHAAGGNYPDNTVQFARL
jgi:hypothetical protein